MEPGEAEELVIPSLSGFQPSSFQLQAPGFCFVHHSRGLAGTFSTLQHTEQPQCQVHVFARCQASVCKLP